MREVVFLHIGQAGAEIGAACWDMFCEEHGVGVQGVKTPGQDQGGCESIFTESSRGVHTPRAVFVDLEPSVLHKIQGRSEIFSPDRFVSGKEDSASNYWRGFYQLQSIRETVEDAIRHSVEECDALQGFVATYSIGGGTGSAATSHIMADLEKSYTKVSNIGFNLLPSPTLSTSVVEPYNAVFATSDLLDCMSGVFIVDNQSLYRVCSDSLGIECPTYSDINNVVAITVSAITASLRYNSGLNTHLRDIETNLVPFPRIHFLIPSHTTAAHHTVADLTSMVYLPANQLCKANHRQGLYMASCLLYRGDAVPRDINSAIMKIKADRSIRFVDWCPTGFKIGINPEPCLTMPGVQQARTLCKIDNTTATMQVWDNIHKKVRETIIYITIMYFIIFYQFDLLHSKRAFVHWFVGLGIEDSVFDYARYNTAALEEDYKEIEENNSGTFTQDEY